MEKTKCPNCESTNVVFLRKHGVFLCGDCEHKFTPEHKLMLEKEFTSENKYAPEREFTPENKLMLKKEFTHEKEFMPEHKLTPEKKCTPLRIFLRYGREDKYAPFIRKLRNDLINRGHEVWLDIEHLKTGMIWAEEIEKGIEWTSQAGDKGKFIFVMTPHSVRYPGAEREGAGKYRDFSFCLNEITMAIEKGIDIFPIMLSTCKPPISIYHVQYLDMTDCISIRTKEGRHRGRTGVSPVHNLLEIHEGRYRDKFNRLLLALEQGKITYGGLQAKLLRYLKPVQFGADVECHLKRFTGRKWLFDDVDSWLLNTDSRVLWIKGDPGAGKTAISSWLYSNREYISAFFLCKYSDEEKSDPRNVVKSIAYQSSQRFPEMQEKLVLENVEGMSGTSLFSNLLVNPLHKGFPEPERPVVVLIDALDEATKGQSNEIAGFISEEFKKLPRWLKLIITSRPEKDVEIPR